MAKLILSTLPAQKSDGSGFLSVVFNGTHPFPPKTVDIQRVADAAAALEAYKQEAAALNVPLVVTMTIGRGDRSPPGFKALNERGWHPVNV